MAREKKGNKGMSSDCSSIDQLGVDVKYFRGSIVKGAHQPSTVTFIIRHLVQTIAGGLLASAAVVITWCMYWSPVPDVVAKRPHAAVKVSCVLLVRTQPEDMYHSA